MRITGGIFRNRRLLAPKGNKTRPSVDAMRERLFNICQGDIEGALVLDLFSGSGALALEAISRGAKHATCVDSGREAIQCIRRNIVTLEVADKTSVINGDVFNTVKRLSKNNQQFDLITADPPYNVTTTVNGNKVFLAQQILFLLDTTNILRPGASFFLERSREIPFENNGLTTLSPKSSRRIGGSILEHYIKNKN